MSGKAAEFTVTKLYRDALRLCDYISSTQGGNRTHLRNSVRAQFRANAALTDAGAIDAAKAAAVRGLSNFMFHEAQRLAQADAAGVGDPKHDG